MHSSPAASPSDQAHPRYHLFCSCQAHVTGCCTPVTRVAAQKDSSAPGMPQAMHQSTQVLHCRDWFMRNKHVRVSAPCFCFCKLTMVSQDISVITYSSCRPWEEPSRRQPSLQHSHSNASSSDRRPHEVSPVDALSLASVKHDLVQRSRARLLMPCDDAIAASCNGPAGTAALSVLSCQADMLGVGRSSPLQTCTRCVG